MNLIVDSGNTLVKLFLFDGRKMTDCILCHNVSQILSSLKKVISFDKIDRCIVSSVSVSQSEIASIYRPYFPVLEFSHDLKLPIIIKYNTPETLGSDRVAAVVGASHLFPGRNVLVIDSGTAITYDILTANGEYLGGNISPGFKTRFRALHNFTGKLPLLEMDESMRGLYGTSTEEAIILGVQNGLIHEVEGVVRSFMDRFENLLVVLTGGDSFFFEKRINLCNFAEPFLVAIGLNEILECNA